MTKPTPLPVPFTAESFDQLYQMVESIQKDLIAFATIFGLDRNRQHDHPVVGSPIHVRSNDGHGHITCMPAVCVEITDPTTPDTITVVAFTRGGEGLGPQPASRRTDVPRGTGEHLSWHWPDDAKAHAWRPPRRTED